MTRPPDAAGANNDLGRHTANPGRGPEADSSPPTQGAPAAPSGLYCVVCFEPIEQALADAGSTTCHFHRPAAVILGQLEIL